MTNAQTIVSGVLAGKPFADGFNDLSLSEAFDMQDQVVAGLAAVRGGFAGYKIAWNVPHLMEKFGMPHPGMGRIFADQVRVGTADIALAAYQNFMIEPEIVARLKTDLTPGSDLSRDGLLDAIEGFTVGYELLDRLNSPADATAPAIISHNVYNAGIAVGETWVEPRALDHSTIPTLLKKDDEALAEGTGIAPQDPLDAIAFLAGHFCGRGETMLAGQLILCGSHSPLIPLDQPCSVKLSMGPLGSVGLNVS